MGKPALVFQIGAMRKSSGQQRVTSRTAHGCRGMCIRENHAVLGKLFDVWGLQGLGDRRRARHELKSMVGTAITNAHIIYHK